MPHPCALTDWIDTLPKGRQATFTLTEAIEATGLSRGAFLDAAGRLQRKGHLRHVRNGFYLPLQPVHRPHGAPFAEEYINALIEHEGCEYYLAGLSAAARYGACYHATGTAHVMVNKRLSTLVVGNSGIAFPYRADFAAIEPFIRTTHAIHSEREEDKIPLRVSSPELTLLDLVERPHWGGWWDNVANVAYLLAGHLDPQRLADCSNQFPRTVVQRTGYLLDHDHAPYRHCADALEQALSRRNPRWFEFYPVLRNPPAVPPELTPQPEPERNRRWRVIVRRPLEPDVHPSVSWLD